MSATEVTLTLGPLRASDRDRIAPMVAGTGVFRTDEVDVAVEVFDGALAQPGVDYHGIGAYEDDRLVGFALYGRTPCTVSTWDLYWIAVDPAVQRGDRSGTDGGGSTASQVRAPDAAKRVTRSDRSAA